MKPYPPNLIRVPLKYREQFYERWNIGNAVWEDESNCWVIDIESPFCSMVNGDCHVCPLEGDICGIEDLIDTLEPFRGEVNGGFIAFYNHDYEWMDEHMTDMRWDLMKRIKWS